MDPYEQYLADAAYEDYLKQAAAQQGPTQQTAPDIGPDYNQSILANAGRGAVQAPRAVLQMGKDALSTIENPSSITAEGTAQTVGGLSAGTAGATALGTTGAELGSFLGPWGTVAGGLLGGGVGFGAGLLGFNLATDAATQGMQDSHGNTVQVKPYDQYLKDLAYNSAQGTVLGAAGEGLGAATHITNPLGEVGRDTRVANTLQQIEPGITPERIDVALSEGSGDPFIENRSLGELLNSTPLNVAQRTVARANPDTVANALENTANRNTAQLNALNNVEPQGPTLEDVQNAISQGITQDTAPVTEAVNNLPAPIENDVAGSQMREAIKGPAAASKGEFTQAFNAAKEGTVDPTPVIQTANELLPQYFKDVGAQASPELIQLVQDLEKPPQTSSILDAQGNPVTKPSPFTMEDVQAARSKALEIAQKGDARSAAVAGQIAEALKQSVQDAVEKGTVSPEAAASWEKAVNLRKQYGDTYETKSLPASKILKTERFGRPAIQDSAVPSQVFRPGEKGVAEGIRNYKIATGGDEAALEPIYRYAVDSFRNAAVKEDGTVNAADARRWLKNYSAALNELPELKNQLSNIEASQRLIDNKYGRTARSSAEVEYGALRSFLNADPEKAVQQLLSGKDSVKNTSKVVQYLKGQSETAVAGLRRGVIDYLQKKAFVPSEIGGTEEALSSGGQFQGKTLGGTLTKTWAEIRPAIEKSKLFSDAQLKALDLLYKDKNSQLSVENAKVGSNSDTAQNQSVLSALDRIGKKLFIQRFIPGKLYSVLEPFLKSIPEQQFRTRLQEAILNPRLARDLLNKATEKNFAKTAQEVFAKELSQATTPLGAATEIAKNIPMLAENERTTKKKIVLHNQQKVTASSTFPSRSALFAKPAGGSLQKNSFNYQEFIKNQSPLTRAQIAVESAGKPAAVSPKGAQGLMQVMPSTAKSMLKPGETYTPVTKNMSPNELAAALIQNVQLGEGYRDKMMQEFHNLPLALAAYNAGPQRVEDAIKRAGTRTDVVKILNDLPPKVQAETIPYVKNIIARLQNS